MSDFETLWNHFKCLNFRAKNGQNAPKKIRNYISFWSCKMRLFEWIWNTVIDFQMFEFSRQKMGKMQIRKSETLSFFEIVKWDFLSDFETLWGCRGVALTIANFWCSENPRFVDSLKELEWSPVCQSLKMQSFLMLPMQRITRLPLLISAIFSRLDENSAEFEPCQESLNIINKVF